MNRNMVMVLGAALCCAWVPVASASCISDAAAARRECLSGGPRDRATMAACSTYYRDDLAECHRYAHAVVTPIRRPPPLPPHHEPPSPPPPHR